MTEADIEIIPERAKARCPAVKPRVISDNGPQFIAKDFKEFLQISSMTRGRTLPYYLKRLSARKLPIGLFPQARFLGTDVAE
jgi:hypothetical protein